METTSNVTTLNVKKQRNKNPIEALLEIHRNTIKHHRNAIELHQNATAIPLKIFGIVNPSKCRRTMSNIEHMLKLYWESIKKLSEFCYSWSLHYKLHTTIVFGKLSSITRNRRLGEMVVRGEIDDYQELYFECFILFYFYLFRRKREMKGLEIEFFFHWLFDMLHCFLFLGVYCSTKCLKHTLEITFKSFIWNKRENGAYLIKFLFFLLSQFSLIANIK